MSAASKASTLAAQAQARLVGEGCNMSPKRWMWDQDGLGLEKQGASALRVYARALETCRRAEVYFESATRAAKAAGMNREGAVTGRRQLVEAGLIKPVGVRLAQTPEGPTVEWTDETSTRINNQLGYLVDHVKAEQARARWEMAHPGADVDAPFTPPRVHTSDSDRCADGAQDVAPLNGQAADGPAADGDAAPTNSGCSNRETQGFVVVQNPPVTGAEACATTSCGCLSNQSQDAVVAQKAAETLPKTSVASPTSGFDKKASRCNIKRSLRSLKEVREVEKKKEKTGGEAEPQGFGELLEAWPGRAPEGDLGLARASKLYRTLLARGVPHEAVRLGAQRYGEWVAERGEEPKMSLAAFLQPKSGKVSPFVARAFRELQGMGAPTRAPRPRRAESFELADGELRFRWAGDGCWAVSTAAGWRDTFYPSHPLCREGADPSELLKAYEASHGRRWRTFHAVDSDELAFAWEESAAWGGCWVAHAPGFRRALHGAAGSDRSSTRARLVEELNASPQARTALKQALGDGRRRAA